MFKSTLKPAVAAIGVSSMLLLSACHKGDSGPVAATVNGIPISKTRLDMIAQQRAMQGRPDTPEARKEIIDRLALPILAAQEAQKKGLDKKPETVSQLEMAKESILANAFVDDYLKNHSVTDQQLQEAYDKYKSENSGNEYKARHILVAKESDAKDIIAQLKKNPKAFESIAKAKSTDPGSKANGGELGWFDPHQMVPEFGAALAKLKKGEMTQEPVKSQFGYHIILLEDEHPKEVPPFEQMKDSLKQQIQQQDLRKMLDEMKAKAKIEIKQTAPDSAMAGNAQNAPNAPEASKPAQQPAPASAPTSAPAPTPAPKK